MLDSDEDNEKARLASEDHSDSLDTSSYAGEDFSDANSVISDLATQMEISKLRCEHHKIGAFRRHPKSSQVISYKTLPIVHDVRPCLARITADGSVVASAGKQGQLIVQEVLSTCLRFKTTCHGGQEVTALAMSLDGSMVATSGLDGLIQIFDVRKGELVRNILEPHGKTRISSLAMSANGRIVVSGGYDGRILAFDTETGQMTYESRGDHDGKWVLGVSCNEDGTMIASGGYDGTILTHYTKAGQIAWKKKKAHKKKWVSDVCIGMNGINLVSCGRDGKAVCYDIRVPDALCKIVRKSEQLRCVTLSPEADWMAFGTNRGEVVVADPLTGKEKIDLKGLFNCPIYTVHLSSHGDRLAVGAYTTSPYVFGDEHSLHDPHQGALSPKVVVDGGGGSAQNSPLRTSASFCGSPFKVAGGAMTTDTDFGQC